MIFGRIGLSRENYHRDNLDFCNNIPQSADIEFQLHLSDKVSDRQRDNQENTVVGKVSHTMEIDFGRDTGYGFNITDDSDRPLASFVYKTQKDAIAASIHARSLIENAVSVIGAAPDTE